LSGDGEEIGLYDTDAGGTVLIHSVVYGVQSADISYGIYPDATGNWEEMMESTPGTHNTLPEPGMVIGMIVVILGVFRGKGERK